MCQADLPHELRLGRLPIRCLAINLSCKIPPSRKHVIQFAMFVSEKYYIREANPKQRSISQFLIIPFPYSHSLHLHFLLS